MAEETDVKQLIRLINDGQVYRYTKKPVQESYLKHLVNSAIEKHRQLTAEPAIRAKCAMAQMGNELEQALLQELEISHSESGEYPQDQQGLSSTSKENQGSAFGKLRQGMKRLFVRT